MTTNAKLGQNDTEVLSALNASSQPLSAYGILRIVQTNQETHINAPVQVYRALDKLISQKLVHRISSLNAYVVCDHPEHEFEPGFLMCKNCGTVTEFNLSQALDSQSCVTPSFRVETMSAEIAGTCVTCQKTSETSA